MISSPILGSSYVTRSIHAANNRMVNLFPEIVPEGGKTPAFLNRCPGLKFLTTVGEGPIRGLWSGFGDKAYVVSGSKLYSLEDMTYTASIKGTVADNTGQVSMTDNGTQLFIACNGPSFIYNRLTDEFSQIIDPDFQGAVTVDYLDGYFVYTIPDSQKVGITQLLNGLQVDPLEFASAEAIPDNLTGSCVNRQELILFGSKSTEFWYNSGAIDFPFTRIQGAVNQIGCLATYSIVQLDNSIFWLGCDLSGVGTIYRINGYSAQRVSTHAIEWQIQQYSDLSSAIAYPYQQDGHSFYVISFPNDNATWCYDVSTNSWHERAGFQNGNFTRHRSNCQMVFGNKIIVGDYQNGNLYSLDLNTYSDNGETQKWLRSWRALGTDVNKLKRTAQHSLQLDCTSGVGSTLGQGQNPQVIMRFSDDSGYTWSNEKWRPMGKIGKYGTRVIWRRLGMTEKIRDRVYEVSGTDPVKIEITGAMLSAEETDA